VCRSAATSPRTPGNGQCPRMAPHRRIRAAERGLIDQPPAHRLLEPRPSRNSSSMRVGRGGDVDLHRHGPADHADGVDVGEAEQSTTDGRRLEQPRVPGGGGQTSPVSRGPYSWSQNPQQLTRRPRPTNFRSALNCPTPCPARGGAARQPRPEQATVRLRDRGGRRGTRGRSDPRRWRCPPLARQRCTRRLKGICRHRGRECGCTPLTLVHPAPSAGRY
jgi:hypothetical protein